MKQLNSVQERLKEMLDFIPISKSGKVFVGKLLKLTYLVENLTSIIMSYPLLVETLAFSFEEKSSNENFGKFSIDEVFNLFRSNYWKETDHPGRYFLSWYVFSLITYVDKYVEEVAQEIPVNLTKKKLRESIKEKMKYILTTLNLWDDFKNAKQEIPELVKLFTNIVEARHKVAHDEVELNWSDEIRDSNFYSQRKEHTRIQTEMLKIFDLNIKEKSLIDQEAFADFISNIRSIGDIVFGYIGFYDKFIFTKKA